VQSCIVLTSESPHSSSQVTLRLTTISTSINPELSAEPVPFCKEEDETIIHFVGKCPKWVKERGLYFNTFYASLSEIQDNFSITKLVNFAKATGRLDPNFKLPEEEATY